MYLAEYNGMDQAHRYHSVFFSQIVPCALIRNSVQLVNEVMFQGREIFSTKQTWERIEVR